AQGYRNLLAVIDRRGGRGGHGADDLLQEVARNQAAVAKSGRRFVEDTTVFLDMVALAAQQGGDIFQFLGDRIASLLDDAMGVVLGEELVPDAVEFFLRRPLAE